MIQDEAGDDNASNDRILHPGGQIKDALSHTLLGFKILEVLALNILFLVWKVGMRYQFLGDKSLQLLTTASIKPTVRRRILMHLANYSMQEPDHEAPREVSQQGIAEAVGIRLRHISQYIRPMIKEGLVTERSGLVDGGRQHQKVYFLTDQGRKEASWMQDKESKIAADKQSLTVYPE